MKSLLNGGCDRRWYDIASQETVPADSSTSIAVEESLVESAAEETEEEGWSEEGRRKVRMRRSRRIRRSRTGVAVL